jgi:hypothetical protein
MHFDQSYPLYYSLLTPFFPPILNSFSGSHYAIFVYLCNILQSDLTPITLSFPSPLSQWSQWFPQKNSPPLCLSFFDVNFTYEQKMCYLPF